MTTIVVIVIIENWPNVISWRNPFLKIGSVLSLPGKPGNEANKYHFQSIHTWLPVIALNYNRRSHGYVLYILLIASDSQRRPSSNLDLAVSNHWTSVNGHTCLYQNACTVYMQTSKFIPPAQLWCHQILDEPLPAANFQALYFVRANLDWDDTYIACYEGWQV